MPLLLFEAIAAFSLVIMFLHSKIFGETPVFSEFLFWIFNGIGIYYVALGSQIGDRSMIKSAFIIIIVSYGHYMSLMLDRIQDKKDKKEEEKEND